MTRTLKEVVCTKVAKQGRPSKVLVFNLTAVWSDGTREELIRPYVTIFDFQTKLGEMYKGQADLQLPELPAARKFERHFLFGNAEKKRNLIVEDYFKKLLQLPDFIVNSNMFRQFFEKLDTDFVKGCPPTAGNLRQNEAANSSPTNKSNNDFIDDSEMGHYESVKDMDLQPVASSMRLQPPGSDALVDTATAEEHIYWAIKDYKKRSSGEVTLCAGSSVSVLQKDLSGWWFVVQDGNQQGWAPASLLLPADRRFLEDIAETKPLEAYRAVCDYTGSGPDEISYKKNDRMEVLEAKLDGWWKVSCGGHVGYTPAVNLVPMEEFTGSNPDTNVYCHRSIYSKKNPPPRRDDDDSVEELYARVDKLRRPALFNVKSTTNGNASSAEMNLYAEIEQIQIPSNEKNSLPATAATTSNHSKVNCQQPQRPVGFPKPSTPLPALPATACPTTAVPDSDVSTEASHRKQLPSVSSTTRSPPPGSPPGSSVAAATGFQTTPHTKPKVPSKPSHSKTDKAGVDSTSGDDKSPSNTSAACDFFHAGDSGGSQANACLSPQQFNRQRGPPSTPPSVRAPTTTRTSPTSGSRKPSATALEQKTVSGHNGKASGLPVVNIGRADCDDVLQARGNAQDYIIRHSTKPGCPYALSVHCGDRVLHFPIELTVDRKYYIGKFSFDSLEAVIDYYSANTLCHVAETGSDIMLGHLFQVCRL